MSTGADPAIRGVGLTKKFTSGDSVLTIFADMSFEFLGGERIALIGESGAGKSTLLYLLGGLDTPTEGRIYFGRTDITALSASGLAEFRNKQVGFVWQSHSLLPEFTALENVMMPLLIRGVAAEEGATTALARLEDVGLRARASHRAGELSGGEQQRVALARALVGRPAVLLADEPTGNLDFRTGDAIISLLADLHTAHGLTSIYVTHNLSFAERCDRILELREGNLVPWEGLATQRPSDASYNYGGKYV